MRLARLKVIAWAQHQPESLGQSWPKGLPLAVSLFCLVLPVLPYFRTQNRKKEIGAWKVVSSSRRLRRLIPCKNERSSPGMLKCLAFSSVLHGCTWKKLVGAWKDIFPTNAFLNLIPYKTELSSPYMLECLALSSVLDFCTWKNFSGPKQLFPTNSFLNPIRTNPLRTWGYPRS